MTENDTSNRDRYRAVDLPGGGRSEVWFERRGDRVELRHKYGPSQGSAGSSGRWARCTQPTCLGEALGPGGTCLAHSTVEQRQSYLHQTGVGGRPLMLRGTNISQQHWDEIVASQVFAAGRPVVPINMTGAEINAKISFSQREFSHYIELSGALVTESMEFKNCTFNGTLTARHARFDGGPPAFYQSVFKEDVDISCVQLSGVAFGLEGCSFERSLNADGFAGGLILSKSTVQGAASFKHSKAHLILIEAQLDGTVDLHGSACIGFVGERLTIRAAHRLGPFSVSYLELARATFGSRVLIEVQATEVNLSGAAFDQGGLLVLNEAKLRLEQVRLGGPLRISGANDSNGMPKILSLRNADAGKMSFAHVDLSRCSFQGAHGLGTIELESTVSLPSAPRWAGGRRFIADEYAWRSSAGRARSFGWKLPDVHVGLALPPASRHEPAPVLLQPLDSDQVASIYRDLRRSLEAKSDMPGAADFYYGEMEMRRWNAKRPWLERAFVWLYWLICGYGLRAGRAFVVWLLLVCSGALGLSRFGFEQRVSWQDAVLPALRATIPGFPAWVSLTPEGVGIETALRVFGSTVIALFLLAVRSVLMRKPGE